LQLNKERWPGFGGGRGAAKRLNDFPHITTVLSELLICSVTRLWRLSPESSTWDQSRVRLAVKSTVTMEGQGHQQTLETKSDLSFRVLAVVLATYFCPLWLNISVELTPNLDISTAWLTTINGSASYKSRLNN